MDLNFNDCKCVDPVLGVGQDWDDFIEWMKENHPKDLEDLKSNTKGK